VNRELAGPTDTRLCCSPCATLGIDWRHFDGPDRKMELPKEVSTQEAAEILGVSKDTVLRLKKAGQLEYRNAAPPGSARPVYRFTLRSVVELRTTYTRDVPDVPEPRRQRQNRIRQRPQSRFITIHDD